jgi:hypothetical protein
LSPTADDGLDPATIAERMYAEAEQHDRLEAGTTDEQEAEVHRQVALQLRRGAERVATLDGPLDREQIMRALLTTRRSISEVRGTPGAVPPRTVLIAWFDALAKGHTARAKPSGMAHLVDASTRADAITDWIVEAPADHPDLASIEAIHAKSGANWWHPRRRALLIAFDKTLDGPKSLSATDCANVIALIARAEEADEIGDA